MKKAVMVIVGVLLLLICVCKVVTANFGVSKMWSTIGIYRNCAGYETPNVGVFFNYNASTQTLTIYPPGANYHFKFNKAGITDIEQKLKDIVETP